MLAMLDAINSVPERDIGIVRDYRDGLEVALRNSLCQ